MPRDNVGALIDPLGQNPVAIDQSEHEELSELLRLKRSEEESHEIVSEAISWLLRRERVAPADVKDLLADMAFHCGSETKGWEPHGFLTAGVQVEALTEPEAVLLHSTLKAFRRGDWFGEWLLARVEDQARGKTPSETNPSPLQVSASLVHQITAFENEAEGARELIQRRPDLFTEPPAATSEPAPATEPIKPHRTHTERPRRARKPRKEAAAS